MNKRLALLLAFVFVGTQVLTPVTVVAQARASVVDDLSYAGDGSGFSQAREESSIYKEAEANSPLDRKVTIRVNNVPIGTFLNSISAQSKINFIMGEEFASKKVSASLSNVTVREALDTLLRVQGLAYQRIGKSDSYVITKRSDEAPDAVTKVYTLSYVSLQPQTSAAQSINAIMPADVTSNTLGSGGSGGGLDLSGLGGGGSMIGGSGGSSGGGNDSAILEIIKSVLSKSGKIAVDSRTNKLIITDVPEVFPQVENILAELDIKAPQILIEAQIVEVGKSSGFDVGFSWGGEQGQMAQFTGGSTEMPWQYFGAPNHSGYSGGIYKYFSERPTWTQDPGGSGKWFVDAKGSQPKLSFESFTILFQAMITTGEARSLGKPKVITMNNNAAVITSSREAAISKVTRTDSGGSSGSQTQGVERRRVGLTLTVTPQVNKEGFVTLTVQPSYSDLTPSETGDSYDTITRAVSTQVRVKSGQTVVLGGLLQSNEKETIRKVPLLGQIPILGWLFTSKSKQKSTTDLIIFLTPTVLSE